MRSAGPSQAKSAASAAGFVLSNYTRFVYVFPANACTWWGLGSVGGNPSQAWIHSKWGYTLPVIGHEMGHNFGLYHSHSLECGSVPVAASCTQVEYGDQKDWLMRSLMRAVLAAAAGKPAPATPAIPSHSALSEAAFTPLIGGRSFGGRKSERW